MALCWSGRALADSTIVHAAPSVRSTSVFPLDPVQWYPPAQQVVETQSMLVNAFWLVGPVFGDVTIVQADPSQWWIRVRSVPCPSPTKPTAQQSDADGQSTPSSTL